MTVDSVYLFKRRSVFLVTLAAIFFIIFHPEELTAGILKGLDVCQRSVIPSLFPVMIFSDLLVSYAPRSNTFSLAGKIFERLFRVSSNGMIAFILGCVCGFPIGIKCVSELYLKADISKIDAESLMCFCGNTGPAFAIAGVGSLMFHSTALGVAIYISQLICSVIIGVVAGRIGHANCDNAISLCVKQPKSESSTFVGAVKRSVISMLNVCGFVLFFSMVTRCIASFVTNISALAFISAFLEVGSGVAYCAECYESFPVLSVSAASFAVSFSGVSVIAQSLSVTEGTEIGMKKYIICKFIQGLMSIPLTLVLYALLQKLL